MTGTEVRGRSTYRRRRRWPALAFLLVLAVAGTVVWVRVLGAETVVVGALACPAPTAAEGTEAAPVVGETVDRSVLASVAPSTPQSTSVRVLNANGTRGQAGGVSAELVALGFVPAPENPVGDDTVYPAQDMQCVGQIRFGEPGLSAARTLALLVPCAELVRDPRADAGVDLALGSAFGEVEPSADVDAVLTALTAAAQAGTPAEVDPVLLEAASSVQC